MSIQILYIEIFFNKRNIWHIISKILNKKDIFIKTKKPQRWGEIIKQAIKTGGKNKRQRNAPLPIESLLCFP